MKTVAAVAMFVMLGLTANAQDAKVVAEIAASSEKMVKNSPFSAEAVSESVQTLADGNRIVRRSTSKLFRNSEGRFRREFVGGSGGVLGSYYTLGQGVTILDPVGGYRYMIDPNLRTTRQMTIRPGSEVKVVTSVGGQVDQAASDKLRSELRAAAAAGAVTTTGAPLAEKIRGEITAAVRAAPAATATTITGQVMGEMATFSLGQHSKWETRTEELGTQNIEGVTAEGTRTITTIPADAIGNERPIEIVYEKWYSNELQLVVMSKHNDPRFGEQTYRLTNITRSEPDPSLFSPPQGYKLLTEPRGTFTYTLAPRAFEAEKAAQADKAAKSPKATPVVHAKP